jgi:nucleoside-diphosphate-sugar epimerase
VFHLASLFLAQHQPQDVDALILSNVLFSTQLAEAMVANGVRHMVNTGTSWQHFDNQDYNPVNLYAATKQAFEDILAYYADAGMLKVVTLALFDTYGPNDPRRKLVALLRDLARTGQALAMSPGEQLIDLVHIDDVVDAFLLAAQRLPSQPTAYARYGVSSGAPMTLRAFVGVFERVAGTSLAIEWGGRPYRPREVMTPWQAPAMEGWQARIRLEDGLRAIEGPDVG